MLSKQLFRAYFNQRSKTSIEIKRSTLEGISQALHTTYREGGRESGFRRTCQSGARRARSSHSRINARFTCSHTRIVIVQTSRGAVNGIEGVPRDSRKRVRGRARVRCMQRKTHARVPLSLSLPRAPSHPSALNHPASSA